MHLTNQAFPFSPEVSKHFWPTISFSEKNQIKINQTKPKPNKKQTKHHSSSSWKTVFIKQNRQKFYLILLLMLSWTFSEGYLPWKWYCLFLETVLESIKAPDWLRKQSWAPQLHNLKIYFDKSTMKLGSKHASSLLSWELCDGKY